MLPVSMKPLIPCMFLAVSLVRGESIHFDDQPTNRPPKGWLAAQTGAGRVEWSVQTDALAPSKSRVLKQSGIADYPVCLKEGSSIKDGFVEVSFKALDGQKDQAGGVIWRASDTNNYYVARANALEDNICVYHTINGKRTQQKRISAKVTVREWHMLRVAFKGSDFQISFDGTKVLDWSDATFPSAGMVGLWTKADSVTVFDDFNFGSMP